MKFKSYITEEKLTAKEAKELAQDELLDHARNAFYALGDGNINKSDGSKLDKKEEKMVEKHLHKQFKRIEKLFGY